jgi:hypothetical protein
MGCTQKERGCLVIIVSELIRTQDCTYSVTLGTLWGTEQCRQLKKVIGYVSGVADGAERATARLQDRIGVVGC